MKSVIQKSSPKNTCKGFTLIEMAIVLGILGTVLAGIFVAASLARNKVYLNQASDELSLIGNNIRSYYIGQAAPAPASCATPAFANTATYTSAKIFPYEMLNGAIVNNPWNTNAGASTVLADICAGPPLEFVIRFTNIKDDSCADLLLRNSLPGPQTGLKQIKVNGADAGTDNDVTLVHTLPVTTITASTVCTGDANTIDWYYQLNN